MANPNLIYIELTGTKEGEEKVWVNLAHITSIRSIANYGSDSKTMIKSDVDSIYVVETTDEVMALIRRALNLEEVSE